MIQATEVKFLTDQQKKDLCLELLNEFGAGKVRVRGPELHHNCTLGLGGHTDNNSFAASVNYRTLEFNCYVCGYGGSLAWWIAVNRRTDTDEIEPWLRKRLGIGTSLPINDLIKIIDDICNPPSEKKILPTYPEKILDRWNDWAIFHPYLTETRQIPEENLERFKIGYADEDEDFEYYQRIIVPAFWKGKLVGWQARALAGPDLDPDSHIKYKNSVDFPRDLVLYGDVDARRAVVVESPMSVLRHIHQIPMVATFGSNVTPEQIRALERCDELILFNENDKAGWKMIRKVTNALDRKVRMSVVENPFVKEIDPADLDDDTFIDLVNSAVPSSVWSPKRYRELVPYRQAS